MSDAQYRREDEMYPAVCEWVRDWIRERMRTADVVSYDTHRWRLNEFIRRRGLERFFRSSEWNTFDIKVDVTAFYRRRGDYGMVFVECKLGMISLSDLSQLLGYCKVAKPTSAPLISPAGVGSTIMELIRVYGRVDVLEYGKEAGMAPRRIILGQWDSSRDMLIPGSILPDGAFA